MIAEHQALLSASKCSFASGLFPVSNEESAKQSKFSSIGSRFKVWNYLFHYCMSLVLLFVTLRYEVFLLYILQQQLQSLLETLSATEPHYIRCVKPNNLLRPAIFENQNVLQQLRCGVIIYFLFACALCTFSFEV